MAALIERVGGGAGAREMLGGAAPGMAGLSAAMQQQHRLAGIAEHIGDQPVAGGAGEHRGCGLQMPHGAVLRGMSSTPALNTLVADRDHVVAARDVERLRRWETAPRVRAASPAMSSLVPTATSVGAAIALDLLACSVWREPRRQAASARRSDLVCSANRRNALPIGSVTSSIEGASSASRDVVGQARDLDQLDADAAEDQPSAPGPDGAPPAPR